MKLLQYIIESPIGKLHLVASEKGLRGVHWQKQKAEVVTSFNSNDAATQILKQTVQQLDHYFARKLTEFNVPLDIVGTEFQKKVWKELSRIPYGETRSYQDIAKKIQNDKAVRAVGTANGRNPISIIVPCHRVITLGGRLGGYAGGLATKEFLLGLENPKVAK